MHCPHLPHVLEQALAVQETLCLPVYLSPESNEVLRYFILNADRLREMKDRFVNLGSASRSGSLYALFDPGPGAPVDEWPVLVLGDEGGVLVLALNAVEWMRAWGLGRVIPYVDTMTYDRFKFVEELEPEAEPGSVRNWLASTLGVAPLHSLAELEPEIVAPARARFQARIDAIFEP